MTDATPLTPRDEDDLAAAEYVLGLTALPDRQAAEARLRRDAGFAASVAAWEARFADLDAAFDDVEPPDLMPRIEARLFGETARRAPFWRSWLAGALAAAVVAGVVVAVIPRTAPIGTPVPIAQLAGEGQALRFAVTRTGDEITVTRVAGSAPATGASHQLWLIVGDAAPVSLGLLDGGTQTAVIPALASGTVLAVSLEPLGGSPTGAPTGQVLVSGTIARSG